MDERDWLAARFEENRSHLRAVAYRMLGSRAEAEDAVQDAWLRFSRPDAPTDAHDVANLGGWLTTIVARVCLNALQSRRARPEEPLDERVAEPVDGPDPEREAVLADSVGSALLVVLDTLAPAERLAFVLHDLFGVPFDDIATIVDRSPAAARQLASRARRRVRGTGADAAPADIAPADLARRHAVVDAFLAASREGDFQGLLAVLDPDVVLRADATAVAAAATGGTAAPTLFAEVHGAPAVRDAFVGRAGGAQPALINGVPGAVWAPGGIPRAAFGFTVVGDRIAGIELVADRDVLAAWDITILEAPH